MSDAWPPSVADVLRLSAWPFALAGTGAAACYAAAEMTLGFFIGPVAAVTLILPVMAAGRRPLFDAIVIAGAMTDAVGLAWLLAVPGPDLTFLQWLASYLVLIAYAFALLALTRTTAAWIAFVVGIAWLAWPVWTAPFLTVELARWLTPAHPLMAINHVLVAEMGAWLEQPLMYRHATLGQDVPYALPRSIWPCVVVHAVIGLLLLAPGWWTARSRGMEAAPESPADPA